MQYKNINFRYTTGRSMPESADECSTQEEMGGGWGGELIACSWNGKFGKLKYATWVKQGGVICTSQVKTYVVKRIQLIVTYTVADHADFENATEDYY